MNAIALFVFRGNDGITRTLPRARVAHDARVLIVRSAHRTVRVCGYKCTTWMIARQEKGEKHMYDG